MTVGCMIDLETLGLPPDGMPMSLGAVKFRTSYLDRPGEIVDRFHVCIDPTTYGKLGFTIEPSTVRWWLDHDRAEARAAWLEQPKYDIGTAIDGFNAWWFAAEADPDMKVTPSEVWGNGSTFDIALMNHVYKALGQEPPWKFWQERCHRTLKSIVPKEIADAALEKGKKLAAAGVLHSALFDAEIQAWQNISLRSYLGLVD